MRGQNVVFASNRVEGGGSRDDWRTPAAVIQCVRDAFGGFIDLDPCADVLPEHQFAGENYTGETIKTDGLAAPWNEAHGSPIRTVFVNPPYSTLRTWAVVARRHWALSGGELQIIILVPARTDTRAWRELTDQCAAVCFVDGRLHFNESETGAPFPSVLVYLGQRPRAFADAMEPLGSTWVPLR